MELHLPAIRWPMNTMTAVESEKEMEMEKGKGKEKETEKKKGKGKGKETTHREAEEEKEMNTVEYIGIDPPGTHPHVLAEGELKRGYSLWKTDPYGSGNALRGKRRGRDPWGVQDGDMLHVFGGPEGQEKEMDRGVMALLDWRGPERFLGWLPWASHLPLRRLRVGEEEAVSLLASSV